MPSSHSLSGLLKWIAKEPWQSAFLERLDLHVGDVLDDYGFAEFDELGDLIDSHWLMTIWGCAFEDFLTREVDGAGNIVDDYLKRRGWKESAGRRDYVTGLRDSVMSLYEVSDIRRGESFLARDLVRGGEPVRVNEHTATLSLRPWDHLAMRTVRVRGKTVIGGGLLPFKHANSELLLDTFRSAQEEAAADAPATTSLPGADGDDPEFRSELAKAVATTELVRELAPVFSLYFLEDLLDRVFNPVTPKLLNNDGDDMEFITVAYDLQKDVTPAKIRAALDPAPDLVAVSDTVWNWLEVKNTNPKKRKADAADKLTLKTTSPDGSTVLGTLELTAKTLELSVNSESRADRGREMLGPLLEGLVGFPLMERQTLDLGCTEDSDDGTDSHMADLPADEREQILYDVMHRHYRTQLDQPIPLLGDISPREAAKTKNGREKLIAWLKLIENQSAASSPDTPMASYDFTWMWEELGVLDLRH